MPDQNLKPNQQPLKVKLSPDNAFLACSDASYKITEKAQDIDESMPADKTVKEACKKLEPH